MPTEGINRHPLSTYIYLCFEAFKDLCTQHGLRLVYRVAQSRDDRRFEREEIPESVEPRGLILRIESDGDATVAMDAPRRGRNVIALIPSKEASLLHPQT